MRRIPWKKILKWILILSPFLVPGLLLSTPVMEKFHNWNKQRKEQLVQEREKMEQPSSEWQEKWDWLQTRQKVVGRIYQYTLRKTRARKALQNYHDWFYRTSRTNPEFIHIKYDLASLYEDLATHNHTRYDRYNRIAYCHYKEITEWYERKTRLWKNANSAITTRLSNWRNGCEELELDL